MIDEFENPSVVRWEKGKQNEIILPAHRNCFVNQKEIIASFHTHPNIGGDYQQEPSLTDIRAVRDDFDLKGENYIGEFLFQRNSLFNQAFWRIC